MNYAYYGKFVDKKIYMPKSFKMYMIIIRCNIYTCADCKDDDDTRCNSPATDLTLECFDSENDSAAQQVTDNQNATPSVHFSHPDMT